MPPLVPPLCRRATKIFLEVNGPQWWEGGPFPSLGGAGILYGTSVKGLGGSRADRGDPGDVPTLFPHMKWVWSEHILREPGCHMGRWNHLTTQDQTGTTQTHPL